MPEPDILKSLINADGGTNHSFEKLALYLSSNKIYKYNQTYIFDSIPDYSLFKSNVDGLKTIISSMYLQYENCLKKLLFPLYRCCIKFGLSELMKKNSLQFNYSFKLKLNDAVFISSQNPELIEIVEKNDDKLYNLLCQKTIYDYFLTLEFSYDIENTIGIFKPIVLSVYEAEFEFNVEHTYFIQREVDFLSSLNSFINLLKLDLCAKASYINK